MTGTEFKKIRKKEGLTQEAMADELQVSRSTIIRSEKKEAIDRGLELLLEDYLSSKNPDSKAETKTDTAFRKRMKQIESRLLGHDRNFLDITETFTEHDDKITSLDERLSKLATRVGGLYDRLAV